jgi:hypothetical protein
LIAARIIKSSSKSIEIYIFNGRKNHIMRAMSEQTPLGKKSPGNRAYPAVYEKVIPIALGGIVIAILVILIIIFAVALGIFPGAAY